MIERVKIKKGSVIMLRTTAPLPDRAIDDIVAKFKATMPEVELMFAGSNTEVIILEQDE